MAAVNLTDAPERVVDHPAPRLVPALVDGRPVHIECPAWCVTDHVAVNEKFLEDVFHTGRAEELTAPRSLIWPSMSEAHSFLSVRVGLDPSSSNPALGRPYLIADDEREMLYMDARQAEDFADNLLMFAMQVRAMARLAATAAR